MARTTGVVSRGIRCPIIKQGDDLISIVKDSVLNELKVPIEERRTVFGYDFYTPEETIIRKNVDYVKSREKLYKISGGNVDV